MLSEISTLLTVLEPLDWPVLARGLAGLGPAKSPVFALVWYENSREWRVNGTSVPVNLLAYPVFEQRAAQPGELAEI
jgi:hypothetical protein